MPRRNIKVLFKGKRAKRNKPPVIPVRNPELEANALIQPDDTDASPYTSNTSEQVRQYSMAQRQRRFHRTPYLEIDAQMDYEDTKHGHHLESQDDVAGSRKTSSKKDLDDEGEMMQKLDSSGSEGWADDELSDNSQRSSQPSSSDNGEYISATVSLTSSAELTTSKADLKMDGQPFVCLQCDQPSASTSRTPSEPHEFWTQFEQSGLRPLNAPHLNGLDFRVPPKNQSEFSDKSSEVPSCLIASDSEEQKLTPAE
ncbi:hypothetical protein QQZ08_003986 [Neonectria magnoliae]|uniref:Uncharacterized protein n=1 Tax=Neonectria magnoliae TaxID=2732573 RepID=A0ABR1I8N7_9HYPO